MCNATRCSVVSPTRPIPTADPTLLTDRSRRNPVNSLTTAVYDAPLLTFGDRRNGVCNYTIFDVCVGCQSPAVCALYTCMQIKKCVEL